VASSLGVSRVAENGGKITATITDRYGFSELFVTISSAESGEERSD